MYGSLAWRIPTSCPYILTAREPWFKLDTKAYSLEPLRKLHIYLPLALPLLAHEDE